MPRRKLPICAFEIFILRGGVIRRLSFQASVTGKGCVLLTVLFGAAACGKDKFFSDGSSTKNFEKVEAVPQGANGVATEPTSPAVSESAVEIPISPSPPSESTEPSNLDPTP